MKRSLFQKKDIILLIILLIAALLFFFFFSKENGEAVEIWISGTLYEVIELSEPFEMDLGNGVIAASDGKSAFFKHSDCPDKVCIKAGKMSVSGQWAACLPNETVIKISKGNEGVDTVAQ